MFRKRPRIRLDRDKNEAIIAGETIKLTPIQFKFLRVLVEANGRTVGKEELAQKAWERADVAGPTIAFTAHKLRLALGKHADDVVETVTNAGYRLSPRAVANPRSNWSIAIYALAGVAVIAIIAAFLWREHRIPDVIRYRPLTNTRDIKDPPLLFYKGAIYFTAERNGVTYIESCPENGGDVTTWNFPAPSWVLADAPNGLMIVSGRQVCLWRPPSMRLQPLNLSPAYKYAVSSRREIVEMHEHRLAFRDWRTLQRTRPDLVLPENLQNLRWSPSGDALRFTTFDAAHQMGRIMEVPADGGSPRDVTPLPGVPRQTNGFWFDNGRYFVFEALEHNSWDLWLTPARQAWWTRKASPERLAQGPLSWVEANAPRDSRTIYAIGEMNRAELSRYDPAAETFEPFLDGIPALEVDYSRDGKWITYTRFPDHTIWRARAFGTDAKQLTPANNNADEPHWSPDGTRIAFMGLEPGHNRAIYIVPAAGGPLTVASPSRESQGVPTWSPDGSRIIYGDVMSSDPNRVMRLHIIDVAAKTNQVLAGTDGLWTPRWSPDGKYIVAVSQDNRRLVLRRASGNTWTTLTELPFLEEPVWSHDSRYLVMRGRNMEPSNVFQIYKVDVPSGRRSLIVEIPPSAEVLTDHWFGLTPDGSLIGILSTTNRQIYALDCQLP